MFHSGILKTVTELSQKSIVTLADVKKSELNIQHESFSASFELPNNQEEKRLQSQGKEEFIAIKMNLPELLQSGRHEAAVAALESYLQSFPRSAEAHFLLASVFECAHAYSKALDSIFVANYLAPNNEKIIIKQQIIENRALSDQLVPQVLKVRCLTVSDEFSDLCAASSSKSLHESFKEWEQKHMTVDFMLLSNLSENITISEVSQYYRNASDPEIIAENDFHLNVNNQTYFRIQETFPFQCLATKNLRTGTLIISEVPFAIAPLLDSDNPRLFPTCFHCLRERPKIDKAFACPLFPRTCPFVFCSQECVLRNVNIHRQECRLVTSILFPLAKETGFSPGFVLLVFRALIRAFIERSLKTPEAEELRFFFRLHSYTNDYENQRPWIWNSITALARGLSLFFPAEFRLFLTLDDLIQFLAVVHSHAIPIAYDVPAASFQRAAPTGAIGLALSHNVCGLGHSCIPSCSFSYCPSGRIVVRTLSDVAMGEPLSISYIEDLILPTAKRKSLETSWKVIVCSCRRCRELTEGSRMLRGQRCITCVRGIRNPLANRILREILDSQKHEPPSFKLSKKRNTLRWHDSEKENYPEDEYENELKKKILATLDVTEASPISLKESSSFIKTTTSMLDKAVEQGGWLCNYCGVLSPLDAGKCDALEVEIETLLDKGRELYGQRKLFKARAIFERISTEYGTLLHPNHYLLYNTHVYLAGLWSQQNNRNSFKALLYLRRALLAAHAVLPKFHEEKYHLYLLLAELAYSASIIQKSFSRGLGILGTSNITTAAQSLPDMEELPLSLQLTPIEACWAAVVNAWLIRGKGSTQWIVAIRRLRQLAVTLNIHTPPLLYSPRLLNTDRLIGIMRNLLQNPALNSKEVTKIVTSDHLLLIYLACARGDLATIISLTGDALMSRREMEIADLQTGLTAIGCAAAHCMIEVVQSLIYKVNVNIFAESEWHITPLLAMAMTPLDPITDDVSLRHNKRIDAAQAKICLILIRRAQEVERERLQQIRSMGLPLRSIPKNLEEDFPFLRRRLLEAKSHPGLGSNSAAHYAAARGKSMLIAHLIKGGLDVDFRNNEHATPLHMAALCGHVNVVKELLRLQANVNALNYRGETPLMLAFYQLQVNVIRLLIDKADISMQAVLTGATVLHCFVLGLTRTHKSAYLVSDRDRQDTIISSLIGMHRGNKEKAYEEISSLNPPPITYMTVPVFENDSSTLFLFPDEIRDRLDKAESIINLCHHEFTSSILSKRMRPSGFTAAEMLRQRSNFFLQKYKETWGNSDLKLASRTKDQREAIIKEWHVIFERFDILVELLVPKEEESEGLESVKSSPREEASSDKLDKQAYAMIPEQVKAVTSGKQFNLTLSKPKSDISDKKTPFKDSLMQKLNRSKEPDDLKKQMPKLKPMLTSEKNAPPQVDSSAKKEPKKIISKVLAKPQSKITKILEIKPKPKAAPLKK